MKYFSNLGISTQVRETVDEPAPPEPEPFDENLIDDELASLFSEESVNKDAADAFWETASEEEKLAPELGSGDALSYDQAQQLGLAPSED